MKKKVMCILSIIMIISMVFTGCNSRRFGESRYEDSNIETTESYEDEGSATATSLEGVEYVMIYNPLIYDEADTSSGYATELYSGDISASVEVDMSRAEGLDENKPEYTMISQAEIAEIAGDVDVEIEMSKAGTLVGPYSTGDTHDFYVCDASLTSRELKTFTCVYAGEKCNVWGIDGSVDVATAKAYADEVDDNIFDTTSSVFGYGRFVNNGGKLNLLCYPMEGTILGFFYNNDIYSVEEIGAETAAQYGINTDHAIININSNCMDVNSDVGYATIAHEYQHQICRSNCLTLQLNDSYTIRTWLNEAMSGYIEDELYAGVKEEEGHIPWSVISESQRYGQSLYNFSTDIDVGPYATVYLFANYLTDNGGGAEIFTKIHTSAYSSLYNTVTEAELIREAVSSEFESDIDTSYTYTSEVENAIGDDNAVWMSKLTLNFYLEELQENINFYGYNVEYPEIMLYDSIMGTNIEGGGRIIVKVQNGKYEIPADADSNLVYIGLDEKFEPVTGAVFGK